ncbi:MAG: TIGR03936 family radical SAM-associated protein [Dictyoglomus thermophilum]|nr:TIGR03936 family radical SAM-associated protein [Dictyoglomus thermophilum]MCX7719783.1 TIGR03936 family radical SAM-associated protein [Dictyoglomus thermophilum]
MENRYFYRLVFSKLGLLKYLGANDFLIFLGRALRRANIPIKYSEGYNPRPLISLGFPCPVGVESRRDYVDMTLHEEIEEREIIEKINKELPPDIRFYEGYKVKKSSLIEDTYGINYELHLFVHRENWFVSEIENINSLRDTKILVRRGNNIKEIKPFDYIKSVSYRKTKDNIFLVYLETIKLDNTILRGEEFLDLFTVKPLLIRQIREVILNV